MNPNYCTDENASTLLYEYAQEVADAELRLKRFAPLIAHYFPETAAAGGIIESPLRQVPSLRQRLNAGLPQEARIDGRLYIKLDSHLPVSGSVKARGGIYEVLKHAEDLALQVGLLAGPEEDHTLLARPEARHYFAGKKIQVGSTGNLGLSIGLMGATLGFCTIVHMSADAKQWKKDLLRSRGATVIEYTGDYSEAVKNGRKSSKADPDSYFVDDENSRELFLGYAVAGTRLKAQLTQMNVTVDASHPLFVYIPCGVGGAPGGIMYGLKLQFGQNVHVFFVEPVQAPCMLLGTSTGLGSRISVQDVGLNGKTEADGLAVGRCSSFVSGIAGRLLSGCFTVADERLVPYLRELYEAEHIFIEPSACAAFRGIEGLMQSEYIKLHGLQPYMQNSSHILWATGGAMVPDAVRQQLLNRKGA